MPLFPLFQWINDTGVATAIRELDWVFPIIETVHVLAIALVAGTVAIVDLRLLGIVLKHERVSQVAGRVLPLTWAGFVAMFVSGGLLFLAEATKSYANPAFRLKMLLLFIAGLNPLVFHSTIYRSVAAWDDARTTPWRARLTAALSLTLWSGIIVAGRAIAYY
ncbi:MAG: putative rane protein [Candidatus Solibacter sp.]|nr:putative rane protein [Candidatus Solibacter sp.]